MDSNIDDNDILCKPVITSLFFVYLISRLYTYQIDVSSRYFQLALSIQAHNVIMYTSKLYSLRKFFMLLGSLFEYIFHNLTGITHFMISLSSFGLLVVIYFLLLVGIIIVDNQSTFFYYISHTEAFVNGIFQVSFQISFSKIMSLLMLSDDCSAILASVIQIMLNTCFYNTPLLMMVIHAISISALSFTSLLFWSKFGSECGQLSPICKDKSICDLRYLLDYFRVEITNIAKEDDLKLVKEGLVGMINDKMSVLEFLKSKMKMVLENDSLRIELSEKIILVIENELRYIRKILTKDESYTNERKLTSEIMRHIIGSENIINKKIDLLLELIENNLAEQNKLESIHDLEKNLKRKKVKSENNYDSYHRGVSSALWMIVIATFFKELLFPDLYPYGLLERKKGYLAVLISPFIYVFGSIWIWIIEKNTNNINDREKVLNASWLMFIPMATCLVISTLCIHTQFWFGKMLLESRVGILSLTAGVLFIYSTIRSASCVLVAGYVNETKSVHQIYKPISLHNFLWLFSKYLSYKMSMGYRTGRVKLGYNPPSFNVNPRARSEHTAWFWTRYIFFRTILEILNDFRVKISLFT